MVKVLEKYERWIDEEPWLIDRLIERKSIMDRTFRKRVLEFSRDVMLVMRSREFQVGMATATIGNTIMTFLTGIVERGVMPAMEKRIKEGKGILRR